MVTRKVITIIAISISVFFLLLAGSAALPVLLPGIGSSLSADEVAKVNGVGITRQTLTAYAGRLASRDNQVNMPEGEEGRQLEMKALDELVNEELLNQLATGRGLAVEDGEVDAKLLDIQARQFGGDEARMKQAMTDQGVTYDEARERLRQAMLAEKLRQSVIEEATSVSDEEVETFYNNNQALFQEPEKRRLRHILTDSQQTALAARARLTGGADEAAVAREMSIDTFSKEKGGDLGWVAQGVTAAAFDRMAFSLAPGIWSDPVNTPSGWNLIKVTEVQPAGVPALDTIREDVRKELIGDQANSAWNDWLNEQRASADIEFAEGYNPQQGGVALPAGHP